MAEVPDFVLDAAHAAATHYSVATLSLFNPDQRRGVVAARKMVWRELRAIIDVDGRPKHTLAQIAGWFGVTEGAVSRGVR
jgi:hypothetical protein